MTTIILAGGKGTRLASVAADIPKPLIPVAGKPFLHWLVRWVEKQGETDIVLAARHLNEQIITWANEEKTASVQLEVVIESEPLDTGGAVLFAAAHRPGRDCIILNGDSITFVSLKTAQSRLRADPTLDGIILAVTVDDAERYGSLELGEDGLLKGFLEKQPGAGLINAGMYLLRGSLLENCKIRRISIERDLFPEWLAEGRRFAVAISRAPFIDIGTPQTWAEATSFVKGHMDLFCRPEGFPSVEMAEGPAHA